MKNDLKEYIKPIHDRAEHHPMAQSMINGTVTVEAYTDLLANLLIAYGDISKARRVGWIDELCGISRFSAMLEDLVELVSENNIKPTIYNDFIAKYCDGINLRKESSPCLCASHGDMFGGQMLKSNCQDNAVDMCLKIERI